MATYKINNWTKSIKIESYFARVNHGYREWSKCCVLNFAGISIKIHMVTHNNRYEKKRYTRARLSSHRLELIDIHIHYTYNIQCTLWTATAANRRSRRQPICGLKWTDEWIWDKHKRQQRHMWTASTATKPHCTDCLKASSNFLFCLDLNSFFFPDLR